jgi:putative alpha-1,2-mannosidase
MFNYGTQPWLTQKWVNKILTKEMNQYYGTHDKWDKPYVGRIYKAAPEGYIPEMDDDEGTMSAWFVLSAMGFYPVEVGKPEFQLTAPIFDKVTIHLEGGKTFEIIAPQTSDQHFYIEELSLNGESHNSTSITHAEMLKGGQLIYKLSDQPNKEFGID